MKRRILLWGGVLFVIAITNSCSFFKKLASTDLETEEDFILEEWEIDWLPTLFEQDDIYFEYNQNAHDWSKKSCTIFNAFGAVSDLWNYEYMLDRIKRLDDESYNNWRIHWYWRATKSAVDLVRNDWNKDKELVNKYGKIASYKINMRNDSLVQKILDKKYTICWWYQWNSAYQKDYRVDWVLDWTTFWDKTYSHSTALRKIDWKKCIKDSYKWRTYNWRPTNIYELKPTCKDLINWWTFFVWWYLFTKVKEDNYEELKRLEKVKVLSINTMNANSELWENTNDKVLRKKLHETNEWIRNNQLKYIEENLIKLR